MLHRFYLSPINIQKNQVIILDKKVINQLVRVLRFKKNDIFVVFSETAEFELIIKEILPHQITATILEKMANQSLPSKKLVLYLSLLKKDNFEWVLQKGTELGVTAFVPVITKNTIVREISSLKFQRYQNIIREAAEQCGGTHLPELKKAIAFSEAIKQANALPGQKIIAWEGQNGNPLIEQLDKNLPAYHLFIGPEGGFSPEETMEAKQNNFNLVSLGSKILRAETAAIAAVSLIMLS